MKGENTLKLNEASVCAMIQFWLDAHWSFTRQRPRVAGFRESTVGFDVVLLSDKAGAGA